MHIRITSAIFEVVLGTMFAVGIAVEQTPPAQPPRALEVDVKFVHNPSIIKENHTWYIFSTAFFSSKDADIAREHGRNFCHATIHDVSGNCFGALI